MYVVEGLGDSSDRLAENSLFCNCISSYAVQPGHFSICIAYVCTFSF